MRLEKYLIEMPEEIHLDAGQTIDKKTMKRMKLKHKTEDVFISAIKAKVKNLSSSDERRLRAAYND